MSLVTTVPLSGRRANGAFALIDLDDLGKVWGRGWILNESGYAVANINKRPTRMHRLIMGTPEGMQTDHINHDRIDNRRSNLRVCTASENLRNPSIRPKGYWYSKQMKFWVVEVYKEHRGVFYSEQEAKEFAQRIYDGEDLPRPSRRQRADIETHCAVGHDLAVVGQYIYGSYKRCKLCSAESQRRYFRNKKSKGVK